MDGTNGQKEREALGISLADVARWSGVALATIRRHEAGELIVTPATRERLARTYAAIEALRRAVPEGEELARAAGTAEAIVEAGKAARAEMRLEAQADAIEEAVTKTRRRVERLSVDELAKSRALDLDDEHTAAGAGKAIVERLEETARKAAGETGEADVLRAVEELVEGGADLDDAILRVAKSMKLRHAVVLRIAEPLRRRELEELEDRAGASAGTRLRVGEECACLLYEKIGKAKSSTLVGVARVRVLEADDNEAIVRVVKTSDELSHRFLNTEMRRKRDELFSERSKEERQAFRDLVSKYWGPGVSRGEHVNATIRKAEEKAEKRAAARRRGAQS